MVPGRAPTTTRATGSSMPEREVVARIALSRAEAAEALGVSVEFVDEHVVTEIRVVRRGRRKLLPVRELERWIDENASRALES